MLNHPSVRLTVPSASAEMTFPSADRDLLMFLASSRTDPAAPVLLTWLEKQRHINVKRHVKKKARTAAAAAVCCMTGAAHLLAASQVHQVEFAAQLLLRLHVLLLDVDQEDAVAARAVLVHVCTHANTSRDETCPHDSNFKTKLN